MQIDAPNVLQSFQTKHTHTQFHNHEIKKKSSIYIFKLPLFFLFYLTNNLISNQIIINMKLLLQNVQCQHIVCPYFSSFFSFGFGLEKRIDFSNVDVVIVQQIINIKITNKTHAFYNSHIHKHIRPPLN